MSKIFYHIINDFDKYNEDSLYSLISSTLHNKIRQYNFMEDRIRSLIGKRLLDISYGNICGQDLQYNQYGKPYLDNKIHFSISHSEKIVAIAVSEYIIGLDLEYIKSIEIDDFLPYFSNAEQQFLNQSINKIEAFYDVWTRKEAILKADSTGLTDSMSEIDSLYQTKYTLSKINLSDNYICHVASNKKEIELIQIDYSMLLNSSPQNLP